MNTWVVENNDPGFETLRDKNTVYTVSNGYYAIKGNVHEYRNVDYPATYIAGVWGICPIFDLESPTKYKRIYHDYDRYDIAEDRTSIANLPDPLLLELYEGGRQISFARGKIEGFKQQLFMDSGVYRYEFIFTDEQGSSMNVCMERFADMQNIHRAYMRYQITALNYKAKFRLHAGIDGTTKSNALKVQQYQVVDAKAPDDGCCYLKARTYPNGHTAEAHTYTQISKAAGCAAIVEEERVYHAFDISADMGETVVIDKMIVMGSGEDRRYGVAADLREEISLARREGFDRARDRAAAFWQEMWSRYDVVIKGDELAQTYMRFCMFELYCGLPRHSNHLFMPVKLLTGDHYQGTAFYDTDLYIEPVFLGVEPDACRELIAFRCNILPESRKIAEQMGYPGAKYAWQVDPYGQEILGSWWKLRETNIHLNVDIVYSIMHYYNATGDLRFISEKAIDVMVEISRFMLSRCEYDSEKDVYNLNGVAGPDESHCDSRNNFYTNYLTKQCWLNTAKMLKEIRSAFPESFGDIQNRLSLSGEETASWENAAQKIVLLYDPDTGLYEQAEGFFNLPLIPRERWEAFAKENKPKAGMWFADLDRYGQTNQPDASAAIWMYPRHFDADAYKANYEFYDKRNCNFSSMSFAVNSMMAKETGNMEEAYKNFMITAGMDIDPMLTKRMDTRAGLHGTALGGGWMAVVYGFAGLTITEDMLEMNPCLPAHWEELQFLFHYKGERMRFCVTRDSVSIHVDHLKEAELNFQFCGTKYCLKSGQTYRYSYC